MGDCDSRVPMSKDSRVPMSKERAGTGTENSVREGESESERAGNQHMVRETPGYALIVMRRELHRAARTCLSYYSNKYYHDCGAAISDMEAAEFYLHFAAMVQEDYDRCLVYD